MVPCFFLRNQNGQNLADRFYQYELTETDIPTYRSNIIRSEMRGGRLMNLMRYQGYTEDFDQWLPAENLQDIDD